VGAVPADGPCSLKYTGCSVLRRSPHSGEQELHGILHSPLLDTVEEAAFAHYGDFMQLGS